MTKLEFQTELRGHKLTFQTTWGLFSPKHIDKGSICLIESVKIDKGDTVLDIGCGYGPIGIALAKETKGEVHMVDKDFVAIEYATKNAKTNKTKNCKVYLSNVFSNVPKDKKFDVIASNLPAKVGKELLESLIKDAKKRLNKGGKFYVVTILGLKDFIKRNFKEEFKNYKKIKQSNAYVVALAVKE